MERKFQIPVVTDTDIFQKYKEQANINFFHLIKNPLYLHLELDFFLISYDMFRKIQVSSADVKDF